MIGARRRVALHHVQLVAVIITRTVEPGLLTKAGYVHHQRVAFPAAPRPAHTPRRASFLLGIYAFGAGGAGELVRDQDVWAGALHDAKRKRHIVRARDARHVA